MRNANSTGEHRWAQIQVASSVGRLLVPTRSLSHKFDIPHPYTRAPDDRVAGILSAYDCARTASTDLRATVDPIATAVGAPSHLLAEARAAVNASRDAEKAIAGQQLAGARPSLETTAAPGPIERMLKDLGVNEQSLLQRGCRIDRATERVMLEASESMEPQRAAAEEVRFTVGTTETVKYLRGSRDHAAAMRQPRHTSRRQDPGQLEP